MASNHNTSFIHLRFHSAYSLLEGAIRVPQLAEFCENMSIPAIGISDRNNLFGALEFSEAMVQKGIQPIIGVSLGVQWEAELAKTQGFDQHGFVALIASSEEGYRNLLKLVSLAHLGEEKEQKEEGHIMPAAGQVNCATLGKYAEGLICLTGGPEGLVNQLLAHGHKDKASKVLSYLFKCFGDKLYVELQRHSLSSEIEEEGKLIGLAYEMNIPLVATQQSYFLKKEDYAAHDALICIAEGSYVEDSERRRLTEEHYLKDPAAMVALFDDLPEAVENTVEIAKRCHFRPKVCDPLLPRFQKGEKKEDEKKLLGEEARAGLAKRIKAGIWEKEDEYHSRLEQEINIINDMGFAGYFLIVADFIKWAKKKGIAVGPGRGSGAGSMVAFALTITDLDPLRFGLLFERFLNPERVSMPDFDIDFCQHRRDEVIHYVRDKYGKDRVAQIITFGKLQARAVLRDVGRVLQMPYGQVDKLCKMVPNNPANPVSLEQAIDREPRLQQARKEEEGVERLLEIALKLEGLYRHASTHAAGVVIGDRPLEELVALYRDPKSDMALTQFNMKWVEKAGLVKFDFLGLKTLTVIEKTISLLKEQGIRIDIDTISLSDEKTFTMLAEGDTVGVFQLEGAGMREAMVKMRPDCFGDIIALVALYRPGPMENIPRYNHCKHGTEKPDYLHPMLKPILEETYGVIIYQEQVMEIARTLSNFSLGEADMLRRAMGKKIQEEMDAQKKRFIEGAVKNGVEERKASIIFDQVDRFAGYGFNKSHAAAYALIAYHTAWLKANHPVAFLAASLSLDFERTDKIQTFCQQARKAAIKILPPNVNKSDVMFSVEGNAVRYALAAVRNVGREMMEALVKERKENGTFKDIFTMMERVGSTNINKRSLEYLAKSGAFDEIHENRAQIIEHIPKLMEIAQLAQHDRDTKQDSLFIGNEEQIAVKELPMKESFSSMEKLSHEFEAIGFYLSAHPIEAYRKQLKRVHVISYAELMEGVQAEGLVAGAILSVSERRSKQGNRFAFVTLSDETGQFEAVIFSDILEKIRPLLVEGELVVMGVHIARGEEEARIRCNGLHGLSKIIENAQAGMRILLEKKETLPLIAERLPKGKGSVELVLLGKTHEVEMKLEGGYLVDPEIISKIKSLPGVLQVEDF